jgi:asparagine synthase (glutamine-hydrolysing)
MCGFSGILSKDVFSSKQIECSLKSIKHRGPDDSLIFSYNSNGSFYASDISSSSTKKRLSLAHNINSRNWIGFNRLAIVDLSDKGMQPFYDENLQIAFMMVGEIYNFQDIKRDFQKNETFYSSTDSEVAFKLYLKLGNEFVNHLRGMFAIVVIDFKEKKLIAWRDRFGIKPFYFFIDHEKFIFSSEAKGILSTGLIDKIIDKKGLAYSLYLGTCPSPITIYKNIVSLQPAHCLEVNLTNYSTQITPYWRLTYTPVSKNISHEEFLADLQEVSDLSTIGDVRKAIMLSGGLDSGILAHCLGKNDNSVLGYTIYSEDCDLDEREYAQSNAENAGISFNSFEIPHKVFSDELISYLTSEEEPNEAPEPTFFLAEQSQQKGTRVLFNALGLDELFGGYGYYQLANKIEKIIPFYKVFKWLPSITTQQKKLNEICFFGMDFIPTLFRPHWKWKELQDVLHENGSKEWQHPFLFIQDQITKLYPEYLELPLLKKISYWDLFYYVSSHHSLRGDQAGMKCGIEIRFPFLDHIFVQKYFNQSNIFEMIEQENKPFVRKLARHILPANVLFMPKKGFSMPVQKWGVEPELIQLAIQNRYFDLLSKHRKLDSINYWQLASSDAIEKQLLENDC